MAFRDYNPAPVDPSDPLAAIRQRMGRLGRTVPGLGITPWNELMMMGMVNPQPVAATAPLYGEGSPAWGSPSPSMQTPAYNALPTGGGTSREAAGRVSGVNAIRPLTDAPDIAAMGPQQNHPATRQLFGSVGNVMSRGTNTFQTYQPKRSTQPKRATPTPKTTKALGTLATRREAKGKVKR
jgi:hypothetical protein